MRNWWIRVVIIVSVCGLMAPAVHAQGAEKFTKDATLLKFLDQLAEATYQFNIGNGQPFLALVSSTAELTLMGAGGGFEKGIAQIKPRIDCLTQRRTKAEGYQDNRAVIEYISVFAAGDLAYTVQIERRKLAEGQNIATDNVIRATHVLRKENGAWKLLHRHADPLVQITVPGLPTPSRN